MVPPRPRGEPECDPPPRPSRRLTWGPRRTSGPTSAHRHAAQIGPREAGCARSGVVWGATPPMDSTTPMTPALLPAQGRQRDGKRQSHPPPYRPRPGRTAGGNGARPPPLPARPPAKERHGPAPRRAAPTGTEQGPHTRTPAPTTRTRTAHPVGGQSGEEERQTPDAPRNGRRHPPPPPQPQAK